MSGNGVAGQTTSLLIETGIRRERGPIVTALLEDISAAVSRFQDQGLAAFLDDYRTVAPLDGMPCQIVAADGTERTGTTAGIDDGGALLVRLSDGELCRVESGIVRYTPEES